MFLFAPHFTNVITVWRFIGLIPPLQRLWINNKLYHSLKWNFFDIFTLTWFLKAKVVIEALDSFIPIIIFNNLILKIAACQIYHILLFFTIAWIFYCFKALQYWNVALVKKFFSDETMFETFLIWLVWT